MKKIPMALVPPPPPPVAHPEKITVGATVQCVFQIQERREFWRLACYDGSQGC